MKSPRWLSRLYQTNSRVHRLVAPIRHVLVALTNRARLSDLQQPWGTTRFARRPAVFTALKELFPEFETASILSYGCSTGEEVADLLRLYPRASVHGTDLHRRRLKQAKKLILDRRAAFFLSNETELARHGPYDLIVACSVFIRHPEGLHTDNLSKLYPFPVFERGIGRLLRCLRPGGGLLIYNANYRVMDTRWGASLRVVRHPDIAQSPNIPLFSRDGTKAPPSRYDEQLFLLEEPLGEANL
jgi:SAM-dependent methyltransferase